MTRDQLLADVRVHYIRATHDGTPGVLTTPAAVEAAEQLFDHVVGPTGLDVEVLHALGLWHTARAQAPELPEPERWEAARWAGVLLSAVFVERPDALPEAIRAELVAGCGPQDPRELVPEVVSDVGSLFLDRFQRSGRAADATAAISLLRAGVEAAQDGHRSRGQLLCNLGYALLGGELQPAEQADGPVAPTAADEVVAVFRAALDSMAPDHPDVVRCAVGLALSLRSQALLTGDAAGLEEGVELLRTAVGTVAGSDPAHVERLVHLGSSLYLLNEADPRPALRDEAVAVMCEAVRLVPEQRTSLTLRRGAALLAEHRDHPERPEFTEAVDLLGAMAALPPTDTDEHVCAVMLYELAHALRAETGATAASSAGTPSGEELTGEFGALTAMVARMIGLEANDGTSRSAQIMDGAAAVLRYQPGTPPIEVLDKIDKMLAQQVAHLPPDQRADAVARYLDSLAEDAPGPLTDTADLDRVIALHERLLGELPPDHEERDLVELGHLQLRMARQQFTTDPGDAAAGIAALAPMLGEAAIRIPQLFARISTRMNLDSALIESAPALGQAMSLFEVLPLLDQRRRRHRDRLAALGPDDPDRPAASRALVLSSFEYHQLTADETAYREAVELMRQADVDGDAPDPMSVVQWGQVALLRAQHMTSRGARSEEGRGGLAAVASDQAASALRGGDVRGALEALEENRAHLLSTAVADRHDVRGLRAVAPDLADELAALRDAYVAGLDQDIDTTTTSRARFFEFAGKWAEVCARIRALPDLDRFAMPLPLGVADLAPAAAEGAVVVININPSRCDAVVLEADDVRVVPLPDLTADAVTERVHAFRDGITHTLTGTPDHEQVVLHTLGWLWDVLAEPVLSALGLTERPAEGRGWPRLWWSPTGQLSFLPLHAAGHHDTSGASVLDRAVSSYTPTIRSLLRSRAQPPARRRTALAVAMPETVGHAPLPMTVREAASLGERLPGPAPLIGPAASRAAVLAALPGTAIAHFACHARNDPEDVTAGHLLVHDGPLSTADISRLDLAGAELAYLSACATARGVTTLADEAFHPASAFQLAGYQQVVATLWEIRDSTAARTAAAFYREIGDVDGAVRFDGALALHHVVRRMREAMPTHPSDWAAQVHIGA